MKILLILTICSFATNIFAWTLSRNPLQKFPQGDIKVYIAADSCPNANLNQSTIESLVQDGVNEFWNGVSTSSLNLTVSDSSITLNNPSTLDIAINSAPLNGIIVGCTNALAGFATPGIIAVGSIGCTNDQTCYGAVLLNDTSGSSVASLDRQTVVAAFAHELGHALGLGHSSVKEALMYYDLSDKSQRSLSQDDMDGISYLYPNSGKLGGLVGACGSIGENKLNSSSQKSFITSLIIGMTIGMLVLGTILKNIKMGGIRD